ncbi:hypothetical protein BI49514_01647 [Brevibacterium iodinum ATCC 49514]|uniref:Uncharacterized protein n=1 Tax=Brevibacterium iodinum ATCC 49514 TaxID=1255616 RepID=A0A2H1J5P9_9MICO|nr:hypothetical protein [Brevibacterium iodinum]SMX82733.1 hypothetical protein BI49514_01647 [Brevibacterium iodinum ATCC 49514]SUW14295.1 Uncharacterised protein [Brevibacterium iodinum]
MCRAATCRVCGKTTWAGCGQHIQSVKSTVPAGQWCSGKHTQAEEDAARAAKPGFFSRLFGR